MGKIPVPVPEPVQRVVQARLSGREHTSLRWSYFEKDGRPVYRVSCWARTGMFQMRSERFRGEYFADGKDA